VQTSVRPDQRFTRDRPCPICGGHDRQERGEGRRCHGFRSADGRYAHCGREEHAGGLPLDQADTYAHRLDGPCRCGEDHGGGKVGSNGHKPKASVRTGRGRVVATYGYVDEAGNLLYQVLRYDPKRFNQRQPDGKGGWIWSLDGARRVPYRLPEIVSAKRTRAVWLCEGEKDADRLAALGLLATTTAQGAKSLHLTDLSALAGRPVVILPDNDDDGRRYAETARCALIALGCRVKVVNLPDLPAKGDVSDWLDAGGTEADLNEVAREAPIADGPCGEDDEDDDPELPRLNAARDDYAALSPLCWDALGAANDPPVMFAFQGAPVRLDRDGGRIAARALDEARLGHELTRAASWYKTVKVDGERIEVDSSPRAGLLKDMLAARSFPLPPLDRIVSCPILGPDGSLQAEAGYHAASRTYCDTAMTLEPVPDRPTDADVSAALDWIAGELFADFPFATDADAAHAAGELILPFVRAMIPGPCPLHVHEAPTQGTGKDLLAEAMCRVATGYDPATLSYAERSEEFGKRLVSTLRSMPEWVVIPNVSGIVDNDDLTDLISRGEHQGRLLGVSEMLRLPARNVWTLTSNNAQLTQDMVRRSVRIRIDAGLERPELRTGFRHAELKEWVGTHRAELVRACLVLVRSWIAAGMPAGQETLGGFAQWARVVGGIVGHVGFRDFLGQRQDFIDQADTASAGLRAFVALWWEQRGPMPSGVSELHKIASDDEVTLDMEARTLRGERTRLGLILMGLRDRRYRTDDGSIVTVRQTGREHNRSLWKLERDTPDEVSAEVSAEPAG
jgi:5S rRNA maturation endonuclease (ribonuclease M5)